MNMSIRNEQLLPVTIFYAYAHKDEALRDELDKHLSGMRRAGLINDWHDRCIVPGMDWAQEIDTYLASASIILLLISPDFLDSDYCYGIEMQKAMERHATNDACVIPIILRPVDWQRAPFAKLQCLPRDAKPITTWNNRDDAFLNVVKGIRKAIEHISTTSSKTYNRLGLAQKSRNRQLLLSRVEAFWIKGVLEQQFLSGKLPIVLGLQARREAVKNPWESIIQESQFSRLLPSNTPIIQVYDEAEGEILILGEPGSGKTTLLLELARDLIDRAKHDANHPIPVVFNLSTWTTHKQTITNWLVQELNIRYQIPHRLGQMWIDTNYILPLLDGLDEVRSTYREECLKAINIYRFEHNMVATVVCSRSAEYFSLKSRLLLRDAVVIQPLTTQQIDDYLSNTGEQMSGIRETWHGNMALQTLTTSPLMLDIFVRTYREILLDKGLAPISFAANRQLLASYVDLILHRRGIHINYTPQQVKHWLSYLAQQMKKQSQSIFHIEQMQPDWLLTNQLRRNYERIAVRFPFILIGALISLVVNIMRFSSFDTTYILIETFLGGVIGGLYSRGIIAFSGLESQVWIRDNRPYLFFITRHLRNGIITALFVGGSFLITSSGYPPNYILTSALCFGLGGVLLSMLLDQGWITSVKDSVITPQMRWWNVITTRHVINGIAVGLIIGLCFAMSDEIGYGGLDYNLHVFVNLYASFIPGFNFVIVSILLSLFLSRTTTTIEPAEILVWSWKRVWQSLVNLKHVRNTLLIGISIGLVGSLLWIGPSFSGKDMLDNFLLNSPSEMISIGISYWLIVGLLNSVTSDTLSEQRRIKPNQGIRHSAQNSLLLAIISGFIIGFTYFLSHIIGYGMSSELGSIQALGPVALQNGELWNYALSSALDQLSNSFVNDMLYLGLAGGLLVGLLNGGLACIQHYTLRLLLSCNKSIPWNYSRFLNYTVERILMHKVGGGYIFVHQLFLDFFSSSISEVPMEDR